MQKQKTSFIGGIFWLKWVSVNTVASLLGTMISVQLYSLIGQVTSVVQTEGLNGETLKGNWFTLALRYGLIIAIHVIPGIIIGLFQWYVLQQWIPRQKWWVLATATGWVLGSASVILISLVIPSSFIRSILIGVLFGGLFGSIQWLVLRRWVYEANWWILSGLVGMVIGSVLNWIITFPFLGDIIGLALMGLPLVWLLQSPRSEVVSIATPS